MARYGGLRGARLQVAIGMVAGLAFFLFGYDQGDLAGLLVVPEFRRQFPQVDTIGNPGSLHVATIQGITVAAWNIGCFISAMLTIFWGDVIGRKKTIFLGTTFLMIGEIIQATSFSYGQFVAGRVIAGFGNGFNTATVPAWQAECTKAHRRGTLLMISAGACIAAGLSFSYWMDFGFSFINNSSAAWRVPIAIQLVFALIVLGLMVVMPESPRWLILSGREDEALNVLSALNDHDRDAVETRQEFLQIKDAVIEMSKGNTSDVASMGDYRHLHRVVLAFILQCFQQMSGINLVTQYLALMFVQQFGYTRWMAMLIAACAGTEFFLASFVAVIGIDRFWGRRSLLMFGASGMSVCMVLITIMTYLHLGNSLIAGTVFIFGYCTFFAIGWQGMAWLYQVEIIPLRIRGPANALSTAANWLFNFVVVLIAPVAFHNIGWKTYIIFAVTNFAAVPVIYFLFPETGYRSLEEVDVIFHAASLGPNPWLNVRKIAANEPLWYGRDGEEPFVYEESEWHKKHVRFSDEIQSSDGTSTTLKDGSASNGSSPTDFVGRDVRTSSEGNADDWKEKDEVMADGDLPRVYGEEACPSPVISRTSRDRASRDRGLRSAGRDTRSAGRGY
ncbi:hypothetical protein LTR91_005831 [Friedmanniomyces endolithicus]|uniref:Major facilitator superfamily (MFS) profile domain-containing protein n=1 Tax=Friedmanniomyces endolithicus TaxID=329885 RepID=A0AAN6QXL5_9PEZI|nr:hypothetical protein LTR94_000723 [Friedmanniomyces endolithicus]KAK0815362.1 hypothetical protein LTR59_000435 [Friedmanniomyces endolithicus]KAK0817264.1 hypothetical protein LTR75_003244 [Friedmanniomyces endolithicus]KAK0818149.1 hypothetical protein LTR38_001196 [Friedmanniomyces endolithicus]KAK0856746.1 hypothetical protein LTR03_001083 [Friedmanniomyces endolithicus]